MRWLCVVAGVRSRIEHIDPRQLLVICAQRRSEESSKKMQLAFANEVDKGAPCYVRPTTDRPSLNAMRRDHPVPRRNGIRLVYIKSPTVPQQFED